MNYVVCASKLSEVRNLGSSEALWKLINRRFSIRSRVGQVRIPSAE